MREAPTELQAKLDDAHERLQAKLRELREAKNRPPCPPLPGRWAWIDLRHESVLARFGVLLIAARFTGADTQVRWGSAILRQKPEWYASGRAPAIADNVIRWQSPQGGWPKNTDLAAPPPSPEALAETPGHVGAGHDRQRRHHHADGAFLALMVQATRDTRYRAVFDRGVDYLLAAQYPNGGWPQYFPLRKGYYSHITYNDDAMVNVLTVLRRPPPANRPTTS